MLMDRNDVKSKYFWSNLSEWDLEKIMPERAQRQKKYIEQEFIPLLETSDIIGELACASGVFTMQVAPFVKEIDAFDISPHFIQTARKNLKESGINTINFSVARAEEVIFPRVYNHFMCLGLFTCIEDNKIVKDIIQKIYNNLSQNMGGGYLIIKDTVAREKRVHYETEEYIAFYRKEEEYLSLYENFILVDKEYLSQYDNQHEVGSIICIFHTK